MFTYFHVWQNRCRLFRRAQQNLNENEDWTFASHHFGIKTYYRREEDQSLSIKLEGEVKDAALFEQVCVLKEVDLHYKWAPFCTSSMTIADLDKLDLVGWFLIGMPKFGMARDGCFRAVGCDNIQEDGSILLAGQGIHDEMPGAPQHEDTFLTSDPILEKLDIPPSKCVHVIFVIYSFFYHHCRLILGRFICRSSHKDGQWSHDHSKVRSSHPYNFCDVLQH